MFYILFMHGYLINISTGVVVISPSPVAAVCQEGDQLELTCTSSDIFLRWEITVFPENMTYVQAPITSVGASGIPPPLMISGSMITFSRLSGPNVLPLISRVTVASVSIGLNGTVVKCFEGSTSTDIVTTTTIRIIDPFAQFGKISLGQYLLYLHYRIVTVVTNTITDPIGHSEVRGCGERSEIVDLQLTNQIPDLLYPIIPYKYV